MDLDQPGLAEAVAVSLNSGAFGPSEAAVIALVKRYAFELDVAASIEDEFDKMVRDGSFSGRDYQRLQLLERRVRAATTVADVGPKFLAALEALGLSPAARAKLSKGVPDAGPKAPAGDKPADALAALRAERAQKAGGAS